MTNRKDKSPHTASHKRHRSSIGLLGNQKHMRRENHQDNQKGVLELVLEELVAALVALVAASVAVVLVVLVALVLVRAQQA